MGLYDYLNGEQVKCFYTSHYSKSRKELYTIGGSLNGYGIGDTVPRFSLSYNYGRDFVLLDTFGEEYDIHFIQNSILIKSGKVAELSMMGNFTTVIDSYGQLLTARNPEEFKQYHIENRQSKSLFRSQMSQHKELWLKIENALKNNKLDLFDYLSKQYNKHIEEARQATIDDFQNKWSDKSGRCEANIIGRLAEAYREEQIERVHLLNLVGDIDDFDKLYAEYLLWLYQVDLLPVIKDRYFNIVTDMYTDIQEG